MGADCSLDLAGPAPQATDLRVTDCRIRSHVKEFEEAGLLRIVRRGLGRTNVYELNPLTSICAFADGKVLAKFTLVLPMAIGESGSA